MKLKLFPNISYLALFFVVFAVAACATTQVDTAGTPTNDMPAVKMTADDFFRAELVQSEFTDEIDEKRYKAIGEILTEISPRTKIVYFVGKLRRVPTQASIEVHWYNDRIPEPMVVTDVYGSDSFSFISSFTPPGRKFIPGNYTVKVLVNDRVVGTQALLITGNDPFSDGIKVSRVKISKKIHPKNGRPLNPANRFKKAKKLNVTFKVSNVLSDSEVNVIWTRGESVFNTSQIAVNGNGLFNANIASPTGLPSGAYNVEIEMDGVTLAEKKFAIGKASLGPAIDHIGIGTKLGSNSMPVKEKTTFKGNVSALHCGLRFLDLEVGSEIMVEWVLLEKEEESVYYQVATPVPSGGSGSLSASWNPGEIYPGDYKVVVLINDEVASEQEFTVK